jgi:CheY-like chemotaxis protein
MPLNCPKCQSVLEMPMELQRGVEEFLCTQCHTLLKLTMTLSIVDLLRQQTAGLVRQGFPSPRAVAGFHGQASLEIVKELLTDAGIDVVTTETGRETLHLVDELQPVIVIVDDALPDLSGMDVCELLKRSKRHHGLKVLLVTDWQNRGDEQEEQSMLYGPDAMLSRATLYWDLVKRVQALLEQSSQQRGKRPPPFGFDPDATRLVNPQSDSRSSTGR